MDGRDTAQFKQLTQLVCSGFLVNEDGEDVFVHHRAIMMDGYKFLKEGEQVEFTQVESAKGWQAAEVRRVQANCKKGQQWPFSVWSKTCRANVLVIAYS